MAMFRSRKRARMKRESEEMAEDAPPKYEGKEHVKYKDPGYTRHEIEYPEDEPHMKSRIGREESHEMEDNYHMEVPRKSMSLPKKIPRARMKMDQPMTPAKLTGRLVTTTGKGVEDTTGEQEMGPEEMQEDTLPKEKRKKLIVSVVKKKMKKS